MPPSNLLAVPEVAFSILVFLLQGCNGGGTGPIEEPERIDVFWTSTTPGRAIYFPSTCGLTNTGAAYCWGSNLNRTLGTGSEDPDDVREPVAVAGGILFQEIVAGQNHMCGLARDGAAYCWGLLGPQGPVSSSPMLMAGDLRFIALAAGRDVTCGLTEDGSAFCWEDAESQPEELAGGLAFKSISMASHWRCGIALEGDAYCWGLVKPVGDGWAWTNEPIRFTTDLDFVTVSVVEYGACGLTDVGAVYCWGRGPNQEAREQVGGLTFNTIAGYCGVSTSGVSYCWDSSLTQPVPIPGGILFETLAIGSGHMCGTTVDGFAYCWGDNDHGQLGDGSEPSSNPRDDRSDVPVLVKNPRR